MRTNLYFHNKQSVNLPLSIFHESTIAASNCYFPERKDNSGFLSLIHTLFCSNQLGNAVIDGDGKTGFFLSFAEWLNNWSESPHTSDALIRTQYAQVLLVEELLNSGYEYVILRKLQSDPLEKRFSQYRQMSGGRFLVSLREVLNSERIFRKNFTMSIITERKCEYLGRRCSISSYTYIGSIY